MRVGAWGSKGQEIDFFLLLAASISKSFVFIIIIVVIVIKSQQHLVWVMDALRSVWFGARQQSRSLCVRTFIFTVLLALPLRRANCRLACLPRSLPQAKALFLRPPLHRRRLHARAAVVVARDVGAVGCCGAAQVEWRRGVRGAPASCSPQWRLWRRWRR